MSEPPLGVEPAPTWRMWAGQQCTPSATGVGGDSEPGYARRWGGSPGKVCGVPESEAGGEKLGVTFSCRAEHSEHGNRSGVVPPVVLPVRRRAGSGADR